MKWQQLQSRWKQWKGRAKEKWGKLTDNDLMKIAGKREQLAALLQERYDDAKAEADQELDEFARELKK